MDKTLKLGVIGAGRRGRLARQAHLPENGSIIAAACDVRDEILQECKEVYGSDCFVTKDYRELIARGGLDGVFICTPDWLHLEHGIAALRAGMAVYLEKPLAISIEECDTLLKTAETTGSKLYVGHNMRFFPVMRKMKEIIDAGTIGEVQAIWCRHFISYGGDAYFRDWHSEQRFGNGLLLQKGAHDIDIIHWLASGYTRRAVAMGKLSVYDKLPRRSPDAPAPVEIGFDRSNWPPQATGGYSPVIDVEDHSMVLLQLDNGVQATYLQCHYTPDDHRNYTVIGTRGRLENCGHASHGDHLATIRLWTYRCGYQEEGTEMIKIPSVEGGHGGADPGIVGDFLHYVRSGEMRGATPLDARMSVAAGCCGTRSLRNGNQPEDVPPYQ